MRFTRTYNRIVWSWLVVLALLMMTLPSGASWQCLNGTPCPANCPMLRDQKAVKALSCVSPATAHCSHCAPSSLATHVAGRQKLKSVCATPVCVLRYSSHPTSSLTHKQMLTLPLLALPPPAPFPVALVCTEPTSLSVSAPLLFYPQRFLRPTSGRAPPVWLA